VAVGQALVHQVIAQVRGCRRRPDRHAQAVGVRDDGRVRDLPGGARPTRVSCDVQAIVRMQGWGPAAAGQDASHESACGLRSPTQCLGGCRLAYQVRRVAIVLRHGSHEVGGAAGASREDRDVAITAPKEQVSEAVPRVHGEVGRHPRDRCHQMEQNDQPKSARCTAKPRWPTCD
jgi:hypothetical protein